MTKNKIKLLQIRSSIGMNEKQKANLRSLKLGKIGATSELELNSSTKGRINIVKKVVKVI